MGEREVLTAQEALNLMESTFASVTPLLLLKLRTTKTSARTTETQSTKEKLTASMRASEPFLEADLTLVPSEVMECNLLSRKNAAVFTPNEEATPITKTAAEQAPLLARSSTLFPLELAMVML